jgi:hypothetical protein
MSSRNSRFKPGQPKGPHGLAQWMATWMDVWKAAYREARAGGYAYDVVIWAMPRTSNIKDPPVGFDFVGRDEAVRRINRHVPSVRGALDEPPAPGMFYAVASRGDGPLKGTTLV